MTMRSSLALASVLLLAACGEGIDTDITNSGTDVETHDNDSGTDDKDDESTDNGLACLADSQDLVNIAIDVDSGEELDEALFLEFENGDTLALHHGWAEIPEQLEAEFFTVIDAEGTGYGAEYVAEFTTTWAGGTDLTLERLNMLDLQVACP